MTFFQSIFLGILQGLTEFLPVSSSGHLVIFQKIFDFSEPPIAFDTIVHFGTFFALVFFFWADIKRIFQNFRLILLLAVGTVPIVFVGLLLKERIETIFNSLFLVGIFFFITAAILFFASFIKSSNPRKKIGDINFIDALTIGLFQAVAILPGVSRSGSTIGGALLRGIDKEDAFKFSFLLGMIAIFGATIIQIPEISNFNNNQILESFIGFLSSTMSGFFALKWLKKVVIKGKLHYFGIYCLLLGIILVFYSLANFQK